jgi:UDP-N-acetylglucosamine acyltransferase
MPLIHPTAIVSPEAVLGEGVEIGPYCVIGPRVRLGKNTRISSHVHIEGDTRIGEGCEIFPGAVLGASAQARAHSALGAGVTIGDRNLIREYVTVHASMKDGGRTVIGNDCMLMANVHIAHDCTIGDKVTMANLATLGGHVSVGEGAVVGGLAAVHQFVRIGKLAIMGAFSKAVMDIAPFSMADGRLAKFRGVNAVGLKRAGYSPQRRADIRKALKELFAEGSNLSMAAGRVRSTFKGNADVAEILAFIEGAKRGVTRASAEPDESEE